jgi:hypothetical protein
MNIEGLIYKILSDELKLFFKDINGINKSLQELVKLKKQEMKKDLEREKEELLLQKARLDLLETDNPSEILNKVKNLLDEKIKNEIS